MNKNKQQNHINNNWVSVIVPAYNRAGFIQPYATVAGTPAKIIKYRFNQETINQLLETKWWMWSSQKIKDNHIKLSQIVKK